MKTERSLRDIVLLKLTFTDNLGYNHNDLFKCCLDKGFRSEAERFLSKFKKSNGKDSTLALQKKEEGNEKYKKKEFKESLALYTESIFYANKDDECLPLAYSNRSIVLECMHYPSESIVDIDMALDCGYPKQKEILILRKVRNLLQLRDVEKAREVLTEALKNCEKEEYQKLIKNELLKIKNQKGSKSSDFKLPELLGGENENFPSASKYLTVHFNDKKGRYVIANQDIKPGDVLFVEKPFEFIACKMYCENCGKVIVAPIPCWTCRDAGYCSPKCRDDSWNSYHSFECGFFQLFNSLGIAHLSLRTILRASASLDDLKKILKTISEPVYENESNVQINKGYDAVFNLVHHSEKYNPKDMFDYVMVALSLSFYLKNHTKYFPAESNDEDLYISTAVILRHILQLICNSFVMAKLHPNFLLEENPGTAIYTSASMMNHSCEPSIFLDWEQSFLIVRAVKTIKKGEEVFNSYGPLANKMKKSSRQEDLSKQYFFKCECKQCLRRFDIYDVFTAFKCIKCKGPSVANEENPLSTICLSCGEVSELTLDVVEKHNQFFSLIKEGEQSSDDVILSLKKYLQAWRIGREIFYKFHEQLTHAALEVSRCLKELNDLKRSIMFLKCCVRSEEERLGLFSCQLARNLMKLCDMIVEYGAINNTKVAKDFTREGLLYREKLEKILKVIPVNEVTTWGNKT